MKDLDPAVEAFIAYQSALDDLEGLAAELPAGEIRDDLRVLLPLWERYRYGYDPAARKHPPEGVDRAAIMSLLERIASLLVDDQAATWTVVDTVEQYRLRDRSQEPLFWDLRADLLAGRTTWDEANERLPPPEASRLARTFDPTTLARIRYGVPAALAVVAKIPPATSDDDEDEAVAAINEMRRQDAEAFAALVEKCREDLLAGRMKKEAVVERVGLRGWTILCASLTNEELRHVSGDEA